MSIIRVVVFIIKENYNEIIFSKPNNAFPADESSIEFIIMVLYQKFHYILLRVVFHTTADMCKRSKLAAAFIVFHLNEII